MPEFDPTIPMGVTTPDTHPGNALGAVNDIVGLQKTLTDLQVTRMTLAAKQKAGQIMATAPSLDEGIAALHADPSVAGFVPDIISTLQGVSSAQTAQAGERQTQAGSGLTAVLSGLLPALNDPTTFDASVAARMKTLSPSAAAAVASAMPSIKASLFDGLSKDPAVAAAQYQQRLAAAMVGAGFSSEGVRAASGTMAPTVINVKDSKGRDVPMEIGGPMTGGSQTTPLTPGGPTTAEANQYASEGTVAGSIAADMAGASQALPSTLITIDNAIGLLSKFPTGGGADIASNFAKVGQAFQRVLGKDVVPDELINKIAGGDKDHPGALAAQQTLTANLRNFVTNQLKVASAGTGSGRIKSEVDAFLSLADITTDPQALLNILTMAKKQLSIEAEMAKAYPQFQKDLKDPNSEASLYGPTGFYTYFNNKKLDLKNLEDLPGNSLPLDTTIGDTTKVPPPPGWLSAEEQKKLDDIFK